MLQVEIPGLELQNRLRLILDRYYRVDGKSFAECSLMDVTKHQVLHQAKLIKKLVLFAFHETPENRNLLIYEVTPDLLIYAQELIFKCQSESIKMSFVSYFDDSRSISCRMDLENVSVGFKDALIEASKAMAATADICDQWDHRQTSTFQIGPDVIEPFFRVSATLRKMFATDINTVILQRLDAMREKYDRWK